MNTKTINKLKTTEKSNEEEFFWNSLKKDAVMQMEKIDTTDEVFDFNNLKSEIL